METVFLKKIRKRKIELFSIGANATDAIGL